MWFRTKHISVGIISSEDIEEHDIPSGYNVNWKQINNPLIITKLCEMSLSAYADSEGPDQTAHLRSLIKAFVIRLQKLSLSHIYISVYIYIYQNAIRFVPHCWLNWVLTVSTCYHMPLRLFILQEGVRVSKAYLNWF